MTGVAALGLVVAEERCDALVEDRRPAGLVAHRGLGLVLLAAAGSEEDTPRESSHQHDEW
jgi:hypothetical protein